jgi:hypothetical protein
MNVLRNAIQNPKLTLTGVIWAASFKVSASHIYEVALHNGNSKSDALAYPVTVDALIVACALWVATPKGISRKARMWAALGRYFGFAATIFANLAHSGNWTNYESLAVNLLPAISVIIATEVFVHAMKGTVATRAAKQATKASAPAKLRAVK